MKMNAPRTAASVCPTLRVPGMRSSGTRRQARNRAVVVAKLPMPRVSKNVVTKPVAVWRQFGIQENSGTPDPRPRSRLMATRSLRRMTTKQSPRPASASNRRTRIPLTPSPVTLPLLRRLGTRRRLVRLAGRPAEGEDRHALGPRHDLALLVRADADERARHEIPALSSGAQPRSSLQHDVGLLLAFLRVVVIRVVRPVRRQLQDIHAPCRHSETPAGVEELAVITLELVEPLDGDVNHATSSCLNPFFVRLLPFDWRFPLWDPEIIRPGRSRRLARSAPARAFLRRRLDALAGD